MKLVNTSVAGIFLIYVLLMGCSGLVKPQSSLPKKIKKGYNGNKIDTEMMKDVKKISY